MEKGATMNEAKRAPTEKATVARMKTLKASRITRSRRSKDSFVYRWAGG